MSTYRATMRVVHVEIWEVDADSEEEAREKFNSLADDVFEDDTGGEVVDWEVQGIRKIED